MATAKNMRRKNLIAIVGLNKGDQEKFAEEYGCAPSYISALLTGARGIGNATARKVEKMRELREGWMDQEHDADAPVAQETTLLKMFNALSPEAKLQALDEVMKLYMKIERSPQPYGGPTVFESDVRERQPVTPAAPKKRRQRA